MKTRASTKSNTRARLRGRGRRRPRSIAAIKKAKLEYYKNKKPKTMIVKLLRFNSEADYTSGMFFINGKFECFSIEDELRAVKVWGETCIPNGEYEIALRKEGRFHNSYLKKFGALFHKGMLCIHNAPEWKIVTPNMEFQYILIHIGNDDDDTAGCPLTGSVAYSDKNKIERSTDAYKKLYPKIANALAKGEKVKIIVRTMENE